MNNRQTNYFCEEIDQKGVEIVEEMHCEVRSWDKKDKQRD